MDFFIASEMPRIFKSTLSPDCPLRSYQLVYTLKEHSDSHWPLEQVRRLREVTANALDVVPTLDGCGNDALDAERVVVSACSAKRPCDISLDGT